MFSSTALSVMDTFQWLKSSAVRYWRLHFMCGAFTGAVYAKTYDFNGIMKMMCVYVWLRTHAYVVCKYVQYYCIHPYNYPCIAPYHFRRLVSRSALNGSVPRYCYTHPTYRGRDINVSFFILELVLQNSKYSATKIKKWKSKLNCHEKSTQDKEFVPKT